jgi:hypothetical protein
LLKVLVGRTWRLRLRLDRHWPWAAHLGAIEASLKLGRRPLL